MLNISFDESGNSGENALDINQPVFVLASVVLDDSESLDLLNYFDSNSKELKFKSIAKSGKHQIALENFLNDPLLNKNTVGTFVYNKEFSIAVHTVDRIYETMYYNQGIDIYKDGMNIALANLLFFYLPSMCEKSLFEKHKILFIEMFRKRTRESITEFYNNLRLLEKSSKQKSDEIFLPLLESEKHIDFILKTTPKFGLDATLAGLICLTNDWGNRLNSHFDILVDDSKQLRHFQSNIDLLKSIDIIQQTIGYDRRQLTLPLKINNIHFVNSILCPQVRVADIIAGATNYYAKSIIENTIETDRLAQIISKSKINSWIKENVWPTKAFTPEDLKIKSKDGENLLDATIRATRKKK